MRCKYPERDLSQRLDSTICRYGGFPYYVRVDLGSIHLYKLSNVLSRGSKTLTESTLSIKPDDEKFDISTIPMGYYQSDDLVIYTSRRPQRLYKQGVSADAISYRNINDQPTTGSCFNNRFEEMILDKYISLNDAFNKFKGATTPIEICIGRNVALKLNPNFRTIRVFYKNDEIGWMQENNDLVIVPSLEKGWIVSRYLSQFNWRIQ